MISESLQTRLGRVGTVVLRYGLVFIFLAFGLLKFTAPEAASIQPLGANSPVLFWLYAIGSPQFASEVIGVIELALAAAMASRLVLPLVSAYGSLGTAFALMTTLSFLFTTPKLDSDYQGFIMKDLVLLGAALWTAAEAFGAARARKAVAVSRQTAARPAAAEPALGR